MSATDKDVWYVYTPKETRSQKAFSIVMVIFCVGLVVFMFQFIGSAVAIYEGNSYSRQISTIPIEYVDGQQTYVLNFANSSFSPDDGVRWYFQSDNVVRIRDVASNGQILFQADRNGGFSSTDYPDTTSNLTLEIIPQCGSCQFPSWTWVNWTLYSRFPVFELKVISYGLCLLALTTLITVKITTKRKVSDILLLYSIPVGAVCLAWYLFAFDIGGTGVPIATLFGGFIGLVNAARELNKPLTR